jgi:hypothetical protein
VNGGLRSQGRAKAKNRTLKIAGMWHPAFLKHLPKCSACKAAIAHLDRESNILVWMHKHRN